MTEPNSNLPLVQAYKEIDRLKAELAKAQANSASLQVQRDQVLHLLSGGVLTNEDVKDSGLGLGVMIEQRHHEAMRCKANAKLAKAQAENVRMAAALHFVADECNWELFGDGGDDRIGPACWDTLDGASNALRDLLAPTIKLISLLTFDDQGHPYHGPAQYEVEKELARLRALTEGKV